MDKVVEQPNKEAEGDSGSEYSEYEEETDKQTNANKV